MLAWPMLAGNGAAATHLAEGYSIRIWQTEDGLPQNLVTSAVQTRDGFLWFGTPSGLARFDGERFKVFNSANTPDLQDRRIARLFEDAEGTLWIGHESGAITRYHHGRFEAFAAAPGVENERIVGLGSDDQGRLWAMRENGVVESLDDGRRLPSLLSPDERPAVIGWTRSARGAIWVDENGRAARLKNGKLIPVVYDQPPGNAYVHCIVASADGGAWILCDQRIRKWTDGQWTEDLGAYPWDPPSPNCGLELRDGTLAIATFKTGLTLVFRDGRPPVHLDRRDGLPQDWVRFLYEDREGNIWAGTSAGLVSIHTSAFSTLNAPDEWKGCSVLSVAAGRDDALWIGTDGAGLYRHHAGEWTHFGPDDGLGNQYITAVTETATGDVWAGDHWWGSPYRLEQGQFIRPENVDETWSQALALVSVPETGELLVGNRDGLLRLKEGEPSRWLIKSPGGSADDVCAVVRDRAGVIWCGFAQGGLARLANEELSIFRREDGLGSDAVQCLFADEDGSLWIGTADSGLTRFKDGRFTNLRQAHGLADDVVSHILDDGAGHLWLSTHHGLQRISKNELIRCADGLMPTFSSQIYDRNDGLPIVQFLGARQGAACKTSDGRLWFASSKGLVSIDPSRVQSNPLAPPVVFDSLVVDGRPVPITDAAVSGRLPPDHERIEFRFSGLSFVAPRKVRFQYQLEGFDKGWSEPAAGRTAFYSRLPDGTYRFRVIASNNDGVWNTEGASLTFTVAPFFWQTWWFVGGCIAAATVGVAFSARFVTRRRLQRRMEQLERQHTLERERARIARDIHDDVGTSLARIAMLSQPGRNEPIESQRTTAMLSRIYTTAREVTRALDEIVWAVDPRHDTLDSLVSYMGKFAQDLLGAAGIRCRLDLPIELPAWPLTSEIRHNLFLAFKEALNNVLKHAAATEVRVSLQLQPGSFVLVVKDDGRGFDPGRSPAPTSGRLVSGHGQPNMTARLAAIGGRCEITSAVGQGTSVAFIVGVPATAGSGRRTGLEN